MIVTELTKEIYDKYPKVVDMLVKKLHHFYLNPELRIEVLHCEQKIVFNIKNYDFCDIPFSMIYGLLEDFFKQYNIDLFFLLLNYIEGINTKSGFVDKTNYKKQIESKISFKKNYKLFQKKVILEACKILEKRLK